MRRKIELWIGELRADLADDSFILMNYTMEELTNPTVVRNSFSKQITLPGTNVNNQIFGEFFRNDRVTQYGSTETGPDFDPTRKTTWKIFNEKSEILDSGYLRLDSVTRRRNTVVGYKVTLYGGLGSFLNGLSYDATGNKRSLADFHFIPTSVSAEEFTFVLNAATVKTAWARLALDAAPAQKWDFINFAPAYNGLPSGTFDANKGILDVQAAGISDGVGTVGGLALVSMENDYTEWMTRDLRSYLQRPVFRLRGFVEALCRSENNNGWTVTLDSEFFAGTNPYYHKTWVTLPIINTDNLLTENGGSGSIDFGPVSQDDETKAQAILDLPEGANCIISTSASMYMHITEEVEGDSIYLHCEDSNTIWMNFVEFVLNAYDADNNLVGQSIKRFCTRQVPDGQDVAQMDVVGNLYYSGGLARYNGQINLELSARGIYKVVAMMNIGQYKFGTDSRVPGSNTLWKNPSAFSSIVISDVQYLTLGASGYSYSEMSGGRSGKTVTKVDLLAGGGTPAEYLLAICKTFGLVMVANGANKTVSIEKRGNFYSGDILDISDRIDMDEGYEKTPFAFTAKWYIWASSYESGEWAKQYSDKYAITFAQQRVDTGYSFDSNTVSVMDGVLAKGAVMALENSKYYCSLVDGGFSLPSVLLDRGAKYTRTKTVTENEDVDIEVPGEAAAITWMNQTNVSYDLFPKAQFHDADNKAADIRDVLLFFDGMETVSSYNYALTDDTPFMLVANGGTPCWLLQWATRDATTKITTLPRFSRYLQPNSQYQGYVVDKSLDFGTPIEIPLPNITFVSRSNIFDQYWKKYITDRYDDDSAVVRCKVNLSGMQVGPDLMRRFYWFDGAVWALNRIINHSVTTDDLTECEFVKVQDVDNYTT